MRYIFIRKHASVWPIRVQCAVLEVTPAGYYAWVKNPRSRRAESDERLRPIIKQIFAAYNGIYGSPRVTRELNAFGYRANEKRVERLMRAMELSARPAKRWVVTTDSKHNDPIAPDLVQQDFTATKPNEKWVGDITYIPTAEGWLYLAMVMDLYSRKIVGWAFADSLATPLVTDALAMAVHGRQPIGPLIFHSDRGSQYASAAYRTALAQANITPSMSRTGCCYDNAVAESFFHSLKTEWVRGICYATRADAERSIFAYIEAFYNTRRRHSTIGYLSPNAFELQTGIAA
jgi:transposase InsO family protein